MANSSSRASRIDLRRVRDVLHHFKNRADVVLDVEAAEYRWLLRQIADSQARPPVHRQRGDVAAVEGDAAFVRRQQPGDHVETGGLAGAVRAEQPHHLAALQREADTADHRPVAVALAEIDREQAAAARSRARTLGVALSSSPRPRATNSARRSFHVTQPRLARRVPRSLHPMDWGRITPLTLPPPQHRSGRRTAC